MEDMTSTEERNGVLVQKTDWGRPTSQRGRSGASRQRKEATRVTDVSLSRPGGSMNEGKANKRCRDDVRKVKWSK